MKDLTLTQKTIYDRTHKSRTRNMAYVASYLRSLQTSMSEDSISRIVTCFDTDLLFREDPPLHLIYLFGYMQVIRLHFPEAYNKVKSAFAHYLAPHTALKSPQLVGIAVDEVLKSAETEEYSVSSAFSIAENIKKQTELQGMTQTMQMAYLLTALVNAFGDCPVLCFDRKRHRRALQEKRAGVKSTHDSPIRQVYLALRWQLLTTWTNRGSKTKRRVNYFKKEKTVIDFDGQEQEQKVQQKQEFNFDWI